MSKNVTFIAALTLAAFTSAPLAAATLTGETVGIDYIFGADENAVLGTAGNGEFVVGTGQETNFFSLTNVDVGANQVTISHPIGVFWVDSEPFNGIRISDALGAFGDFLSVSLASSDYAAPVLSFDADNLYLNFAGSGAGVAGDQVVIDFTVSDVTPVPLPAGGLLLLSGLGAIAVFKRRKKSAA
ncbi:VPLPA-CTERM sorting domain-containing protein [Dinoroseobacter sp. S375]|uniref:VPLPA-CTERM sorting domain-containing protein n=1 Tax=Dinoroseobacter sp. S375 TaxID=3415136 RepID=UPI003C7AE4FA